MKVCQKLEAAGFEKVVNVDGGTSAWLDANLPSVTGKKAMSLERQVRIVAGSLVVIGAALVISLLPVGLVCLPLLGRAWYLQGLLIPVEWVCSLPGCPGTGHNRNYHTSTGPLGTAIFFRCFDWCSSSSCMKLATMGGN